MHLLVIILRKSFSTHLVVTCSCHWPQSNVTLSQEVPPCRPCRQWQDNQAPPLQATSLRLLSEAISVSQMCNLLSSFAQFFTKLLGQAIMHLSMVGFPERGDCFRRVHMSAMHCRVFPKPISSAMIHLSHNQNNSSTRIRLHTYPY